MDSELRSGEMQMSWYGRRAWRSTRWGVVVGAVLAAGVVSPALAMGRSGGRVVNAPVRVARTAAGAIGFREVGRGSPLLLITGLGASMDDWAPSFVNALAAGHRVVIFDNAGVGQTSGLGTPLTIAAMANQTSALISSLRLGRPAVLGWSLGGMVAQALAVLHPSQVSRLILAATQAGTGNALPVPSAAAKAVNSSNPARTLSVLFPPNQGASQVAYVKAILGYPGFYQVSAAVKGCSERCTRAVVRRPPARGTQGSQSAAADPGGRRDR
jgi:pimeloyl-ACP methyl ester carboxylesterase